MNFVNASIATIISIGVIGSYFSLKHLLAYVEGLNNEIAELQSENASLRVALGRKDPPRKGRKRPKSYKDVNRRRQRDAIRSIGYIECT